MDTIITLPPHMTRCQPPPPPDFISLIMARPIRPLAVYSGTRDPCVYNVFCNGNTHWYGASLQFPVYSGKTTGQTDRRRQEHADSITEASNLNIADFYFQFLPFNPSDPNTALWVNGAEAALIDHFKPVWNCRLKGFGSHNQGVYRDSQKDSAWDTRHPGRKWTRQNTTSHEVRINELFSFR